MSHFPQHLNSAPKINKREKRERSRRRWEHLLDRHSHGAQSELIDLKALLQNTFNDTGGKKRLIPIMVVESLHSE